MTGWSRRIGTRWYNFSVDRTPSFWHRSNDDTYALRLVKRSDAYGVRTFRGRFAHVHPPCTHHAPTVQARTRALTRQPTVQRQTTDTRLNRVKFRKIRGKSTSDRRCTIDNPESETWQTEQYRLSPFIRYGISMQRVAWWKRNTIEKKSLEFPDETFIGNSMVVRNRRNRRRTCPKELRVTRCFPQPLAECAKKKRARLLDTLREFETWKSIEHREIDYAIANSYLDEGW